MYISEHECGLVELFTRVNIYTTNFTMLGEMFLFEICLIHFNFQTNYIFYFLLPISRESIAFGSNFRNGNFDGFTRFEVP